MTKNEAIKHFGTQVLLAQALKISQGTVAGWGDSPPELRQLQLEAMTKGVLKAGPECDPYRVPKRKAKVPA